MITKVEDECRQSKWHRQSDLSIQTIAVIINKQKRGLINYFGAINSIGLHILLMQLFFRLAKWAMIKYKKFWCNYGQAYKWLKEIKDLFPDIFYHYTVFN